MKLIENTQKELNPYQELKASIERSEEKRLAEQMDRSMNFAGNYDDDEDEDRISF